ncbi:MAG: SGNH/GDSL hydrolase family protein [Eubacteriales bacterium]|jgi:lysophospholipase L1-like esterase
MNSTNQKSPYLRAAYSAVIVILVLLFICIAELVVLALLKARLQEPEGQPKDTAQAIATSSTGATDTTEPPANPVYLGPTEDYGQEYIDKMIFVGDSTTYHLLSTAVLSGGRDTKQVWVPIVEEGGNKLPTLSLDIDTINKKITNPRTGEKMTIPEAAAVEKPEYMVITLGINNGVPSLGENEFKKCYRKLLDAIIAASPDTKIILQSIFPVTSKCTQKHPKITNEKIDRANGWVADLALEYKEYGVRYLDTNSVLKDETGCLNPAYTDDSEGIHLNKAGYEAVLRFIRTHGYPKS